MDLDASKTRFRATSIEVEKIQRQMSFVRPPASAGVSQLNVRRPLGAVDEDDELMFDDVYNKRGRNMRMSQSLGNDDYETVKQFEGLQIRDSYDQVSEKKNSDVILNYTESLGVLGEESR